MFDIVDVLVKAGRGGGGAVSFRREKFVPLGGPDGGDGGRGGDVVVRADSRVTNLIAFRKNEVYKAGNGGDGRGSKKHGKNGVDLILVVPLGTVVFNKTQLGDDTDIYNLMESGDQVVVAKGGRGGLGNTHFTSSTNQTPKIAQKGEAGEEKELVFELKLIADVGVIGYPNAGKSSLLTSASAAKPKIAGYPFTTLEPVLGVVEVGHRSFVLAEIPGLIVGAHQGRGLGHDFLRHVVRTKVLIHIVDGSSLSPVDDMIRVNTELGLFDSALALKTQLVVVNKIDLPQVQDRQPELRSDFKSIGVLPLFVSALTGEGVSALTAKVLEMLEQVTARDEVSGEATVKVFRPKPITDRVSVHQEGGTFVVLAPGLERIVAGTDLTDPEARRQLNRQFSRPEVKRALDKAGAKTGDKIRCGSLEWQL